MGGISDIRAILPGATMRYGIDGKTQIIEYVRDGVEHSISVPPGANLLKYAREAASEVKGEVRTPLAQAAGEGIQKLVAGGDGVSSTSIEHGGETYELVDDGVKPPKPALFF